MKFDEKSSEYPMMGSAARAVVMDDLTAKFIQTHEKSNVVCIDCGLETMVWRLEGYRSKAHFYEIDFASVIAQLDQVLGKCPHETLIAGDVNKLSLSDYMNHELPILFVVAGVFHYFKEEAVLTLIKNYSKNLRQRN